MVEDFFTGVFDFELFDFTELFDFAELDFDERAFADLAEELFDFDDLDFAERAFVVFVEVQRTRVLLLCALRARVALVQRTGLGAVQPTSASARNADGIASTGVGPSITARTAASERSDRTSAMIRAGRCAFAA